MREGKGPITPDGEMGEEKYRLVVEGPPNWTSFRDFWKMFYDEGAVVVASTYAKVGGVYDFGFRHDPDHPLESLADYCLGCYTNLNLPSRIDMICKYIDEYQADGLLINSIKSCNSFSAGQLLILREVEKRTGKPAAFIETDLVDPRYFSAANVKNRLESYFQMVKQKRAARRSPRTERNAMRCFIGIDLGSTTTKAVVIDENRNVLGRGITNSRSNYDTAAAIAKQEALVNGRFYLFRQALGSTGALNGALDGFLGQLERDFRLGAVPRAARRPRGDLPAQRRDRQVRRRDDGRRRGADRGVQAHLPPRRRRCSRPAPSARSDFFRDIAGQPVPRDRRDGREGGRHPLRLPAQRVRPLDHRGREPRLRRLDQAAPARGARAHVRRAARHRRPQRDAGRGADQGHPRHARWRRPTSSAPATAARGCRSRRSTSAPRSCATASART